MFHPINLKTQQVPESKKDTSLQITPWDLDTGDEVNYYHTYHSHDDWLNSRYVSRNDFPQQIIQDVRNSPVASTCIEVIHEYIYGDGFVEEAINDIEVNKKGETWRDILLKISRDVALLDGFALHVNYALTGEKKDISHVPFEQTRLGLINKGVVEDIKVNPYFGIPTAEEKKYTKTYYTFNDDPKFVQNQIAEHQRKYSNQEVKFKYPGQILWCRIEKPLSRIYPIPPYFSGINWIRIDHEIQQFHERNISNNFFGSFIINVEGDPDQPAGEKDSDGNYTSNLLTEYQKQWKKYSSGGKNAGVPLFNFFRTSSERASVEALPQNANDTLFQTLQDQTNQQICIATQVPPILIGVQTQGTLGENQQIINAIRKMQASVKSRQHFIEEQLSQLSQIDFTIKDVNKIDILPDWAFDVLSEQEKRKYLEERFGVKLINKVTL